jgi:hypothetical protein
LAKCRSLGGRKFGIVFHGLSVIFSSGFWFTIGVLLGTISANEASRGLPYVFYAALVKRLFPTFSSSALLPNSFGISGGMCGVAHAGMFPLYLNSGIVWVTLLLRHLFCRLLGPLVLPCFCGIFGLRGIGGSFMMCTMSSGSYGGKLLILFMKLS